MHVTMTPDEWSLFAGFVRCARRYIEFGSGASTVLAASLANEQVTSLDSSRDWLDRVATECRARKTRLFPRLTFVDIGETTDWGFPKDETARALWPSYHASIWDDPAAAQADLFLIDGRFRVACLAQVLLHAGDHAYVAFHDYASRIHYRDTALIAHEIVRVNDLSIFVRRPDFDSRTAERILEDHAYDPR